MATASPIDRVAGGALADRLQDALDDEFDAREKAIKHEVYRMLNKGSLDPQIAVQKWIEMHAMYRLHASISRRSK